MILFKHPLRIVALLFSLALVTSCKKDKDNDDPGSTGGYPKEVNIEYKATTTTSGLTTVGVHYHNETGGLTDNDAAAIPFSVKLKKKVNRYEVIVFSAAALKAGNLKLDILINGTVVKSESFSSTSNVNGQIAYQFMQ
ncbi:hypothetical protein [Paraflavitalea sp. CAU 1676]|uniref:hypothetical protein n=1 Tax=Paraflavitalea sp. CAU 1676 TaxID=3032598 RepID=UPI0023DA4B38|nr:hypothetical protein [Paraflavitalea sp. CAU 1676]MDF2193245.1 hypothetical protein [Paraflavitalea sp. CAU 1676]